MNTLFLETLLPPSLLIAGAVLMAMALLAGQRRSHPRNLPPRRLFRCLARALAISHYDRLLLGSVARRQHIPPAALLLSPHTLRHHARAYLSSRPWLLRPLLAQRLEVLARQLNA